MGTLLTLEEAAARLRMPVATLRFWRAQGRGPHSGKIGRRVMYDAAELDRWVASQMEGSGAA